MAHKKGGGSTSNGRDSIGKRLGFMSLVLLLFGGMRAVNAQTPQQIAQKAFNSTVLLVMEDANGQPLGTHLRRRTKMGLIKKAVEVPVMVGIVLANGLYTSQAVLWECCDGREHSG